MYALNLLQCARVSLVFIKNVVRRQHRNAFSNEPIQLGLDGLQFICIAKTQHGHKTMLFKMFASIHTLGVIPSKQTALNTTAALPDNATITKNTTKVDRLNIPCLLFLQCV